jgi:hypothetical protein
MNINIIQIIPHDTLESYKHMRMVLYRPSTSQRLYATNQLFMGGYLGLNGLFLKKPERLGIPRNCLQSAHM